MKFKHILILLLSVLLFSCGGSKDASTPPPIEKHTLTIKEIVHDTTFVTLADTATYRALLDCQNGKVIVKEVYTNTEGKTHLKKPKVKIQDNKLSIDCEARAQELFAQWKSQEKTEVTETIKHLTVEVIKPLTFWQQLQIWLGRILLFVFLFTSIKYLIKIYKPL